MGNLKSASSKLGRRGELFKLGNKFQSLELAIKIHWLRVVDGMITVITAGEWFPTFLFLNNVVFPVDKLVSWSNNDLEVWPSLLMVSG